MPEPLPHLAEPDADGPTAARSAGLRVRSLLAGVVGQIDARPRSPWYGEKYPDGSFWHQWMQTWFTGPQFYFDCVSGGEPLPGPPPPGGCGGAIPSEQPNAP